MCRKDARNRHVTVAALPGNLNRLVCCMVPGAVELSCLIYVTQCCNASHLSVHTSRTKLTAQLHFPLWLAVLLSILAHAKLLLVCQLRHWQQCF